MSGANRLLPASLGVLWLSAFIGSDAETQEAVANLIAVGFSSDRTMRANLLRIEKLLFPEDD